jgi:hypothetical protein
VQMAAQFFDALAQNAKRLAELKALDVPVKLIWGQFDPLHHPRRGRAAPDPAEASLSHRSAGGSLVAGRRTGTSGKGDTVITPHKLSKINRRRDPAEQTGRPSSTGTRSQAGSPALCHSQGRGQPVLASNNGVNRHAKAENPLLKWRLVNS